MAYSKEENIIISQLQAGERKVINEFIDSYGKFMYNVTYRVLGNIPDAEEATQDLSLIHI